MNYLIKNCIVLVFCLLAKSVLAQYQITGIVADRDSQEKLEAANVKLLTTDSVFVQGAITGKDGRFILKN
ncbi:MAG: carboxypeptidase-like regulatory domain-containing protein, partial [Bacteroidales bacterium]|nr:carboxypeptidase-like regulatory domain-containing protein [Bacteroidales bacterium]